MKISNTFEDVYKKHEFCFLPEKCHLCKKACQAFLGMV